MVVNTDLFQLKSFIDRGIYYVGEALVIGAVLVVIVLFLFLLNVRTTFITLTAIPLSLVITTLVFRLIGVLTGTELSINVMTLGGIAVAMGELVDDAIVDVENIFRRLRENNASPDAAAGRCVVVYEASREIRSAIVFGTAVVILAFLPLFALSGVEGRLFAPLGIAYIVSILASLLVSLTVTPVLSYYLLPQSKATHGHQDGLLLRLLKWAAGYLIRFSMRHAGAAAAADLGAGRRLRVWQLTRLGADFLPQVRRGQRADQRHPARRLVAEGVERGVGRSSTPSSRRMQKIDRQPRRRRSCTSPAAPAGPSWTSTPSRSTSASTS